MEGWVKTWPYLRRAEKTLAARIRKLFPIIRRP